MTYRDVTREAVLKAVTEYDELGQAEFLVWYRYKRATSYRLIYDGKEYDSKAIVGVAHGYLPGEGPLTNRDSLVVRRLQPVTSGSSASSFRLGKWRPPT